MRRLMSWMLSAGGISNLAPVPPRTDASKPSWSPHFGHHRTRLQPRLYARGDHPGTGEVSSEGHRIVYVVDPDTGRNADAGDVTVLRLFGPGQLRQS
jgi:hypothetical protein